MMRKLKKILILSLAVMLVAVAFSGAVSAERVSATPDNSQFTYYGTGTYISQCGFEYSIDIGDSVYYLPYDQAEALSEYSPNLNDVYLAAMDAETPDKVYEGRVNYAQKIELYDTSNTGTGDDNAAFPVDKKFTFEYKTGQTGVVSDGKIVTHIYDSNGKQLI